jgi:hypothetical protein
VYGLSPRGSRAEYDGYLVATGAALGAPTVGFLVEYTADTFAGTLSDFGASVANGVLKGSAKVDPSRSRIRISKHTFRLRSSSTPSGIRSWRSPRDQIERVGDELKIEGDDVTIDCPAKPERLR